MTPDKQILKAWDELIFRTLKYFPKWLHPNYLTILRLVLLIPLALALWHKYYLLFIIIFLFAYLTDIFDGALARYRKQQSAFGVLMDPLADKIIFYLALFGLAYGKISLFLFTILLITEVVLYGFALIYIPLLRYLKLNFVFASNIFGKLKMATQILAIIFLFFNFVELGSFLLWLSLGWILLGVIKNVYFDR